MKPIIVKVNDKDKIELTSEQLEKIIEEAYNSGYNDGCKNNTYPSYPIYPYQPMPIIYNTGTPWWYDPYTTITCEA